MKFKVYTPGPGFTWEAESLEAATAEAVAYLPLLHRGWYTEMTYAPCSRHTDCGVIIGRGESFNSRGKRQSWVAVVLEQDQQHSLKINNTEGK